LNLARRLIVTADDLGSSAHVNTAIVRSLEQGLVSYASLMVNLEGFEHACDLIHAHRLQDRIGLHLNLSEGASLTEPIRRTPLYVNGQFAAPTLMSYYRIVNGAARLAVAEEVTAQIARARAVGIALSHLDSHNDLHTAPAIARVVADLAKRGGITRIRPARNCGPRQGVIRWIHQRRYNESLGHQGLRCVDYVGTIDDLLWLSEAAVGRSQFFAEAMTHPTLSLEGDQLVDAPPMQPLAFRVRQLENRGFNVVARPF
jgi:hypothetical protein